MSERNERVDYRCRISMNKEPSSIALINYIKQGDGIAERDKVLPALFGYWLPFALKANGSYSEAELRQHAIRAIYRLKLHILLLSEAFLVEDFPVNSSSNISARPTAQEMGLNLPISNVTNKSVIESEIFNDLRNFEENLSNLMVSNITNSNDEDETDEEELIKPAILKPVIDFLENQNDNAVGQMFG